uniref:A20-type domain-containing protein n=1 Tax=Romanomermis culicivorax TaxID=13658 RepID=A0A915I9C6_ROMCU
MSSSNPKLQIQISNDDLLCKNCREFYGNPQWHGLCSKCYRESAHSTAAADHNFDLQRRKNPPSATSKNAGANAQDASISPSRNWHPFGFDKFLEKKNNARRSSTLKSLLKKSPSSGMVFMNLFCSIKF